MRDLDAAFIAALTSGAIRPRLLFHGRFGDGDLRLWSGVEPLTWAGVEWVGAGDLLAIDTVTETSEIVAQGTKITLSGIPEAFEQIALAQVKQGQVGEIYLGLMDEAGALIGDPELVFRGLIDVPEAVDDRDTCTITLSLESELAGLTRASEWRYTHESQQALYPGDRAFEYVTAIQGQSITWGA